MSRTEIRVCRRQYWGSVDYAFSRARRIGRSDWILMGAISFRSIHHTMIYIEENQHELLREFVVQ